MQIDKKRIFYINSGNTLKGRENTFSVSLDIPEWGEYNRITLLSANTPVSYYCVQDGLNTFTLIEGLSEVVITIPEGNYNVNSFALQLEAKLTASSPNGYSYIVKYPNSFSEPDTGKFIFTTNGVGTIGFRFGKNPLNEQFGFDRESVVLFSGGELRSANVVSFVPETSVYVHCNVVDGENGSDVLDCLLSNNSVPFSVNTYINPAPLESSKRLSNSRAKNIVFSITNELSDPLYLNGVDIVLVVLLYRESDIYQKTLGFYEGVKRYISFRLGN